MALLITIAVLRMSLVAIKKCLGVWNINTFGHCRNGIDYSWFDMLSDLKYYWYTVRLHVDKFNVK